VFLRRLQCIADVSAQLPRSAEAFEKREQPAAMRIVEVYMTSRRTTRVGAMQGNGLFERGRAGVVQIWSAMAAAGTTRRYKKRRENRTYGKAHIAPAGMLPCRGISYSRRIQMSAVTGVAVSWERIVKAFGVKSPEHLKSLAKPAAKSAITKLETLVGVALPDEFKSSLAIHDGQKPGAEVGDFPGFYADDETGSYYLMGSKAVVRDWKTLRSVMKSGDFDDLKTEPDRGVGDSWWDLPWIPFAANGGGDYLCLDMAPAARGTRGQIIGFVHDSPQRKIHAKSFGDWLQRCAKTFARGELPDLE
jgi:cell wall assembly regulator SMI1